MKYIISNTDKLFQRNFLWQFWRFIMLGLRFAGLTKRH